MFVGRISVIYSLSKLNYTVALQISAIADVGGPFCLLHDNEYFQTKPSIGFIQERSSYSQNGLRMAPRI